MVLNCGLELLDILCTTFSERCLCLTVPLFPLLRGCIDLINCQSTDTKVFTSITVTHRLPSTFTLLDLCDFLHKALLEVFWRGLGERFFIRVLGFGRRWCVFDTGHAQIVGIRVVVDHAVESTNDLLVQKRRQGSSACQATRLTALTRAETGSNCLSIHAKRNEESYMGYLS